MYDFQRTVLISAKPGKWNLVFRYTSMLLFILAALATIWINPNLFMLPTILFGIWCYFSWFKSSIEYESGYFDGELTFDRITDKRKRKHILTVNMENVEIIAPSESNTMMRLQNNGSVKHYDCSSGNKSHKRYEVAVNDPKQKYFVIFEPDTEMLDAICVKFPRKVER